MRGRALVIAALVAVAGGWWPMPGVGSVDASTAPPTVADTVPPASVDPGSDPARAALAAVVGWLADPASAEAASFTDEFIQQVPIEQLRQILAELGTGEWTVVAVESMGPGAVAALLEGPGPAMVVQLQVDADGLIAGLLFQPAELVDPPADLGALVERLQATAPLAGFLLADVAADGSCTPVAELAPSERLPIGSVFKLYVLGAVAAMVESGEIGWDDLVEIRDELDSLPSGETQDDPAGSRLTVLVLANRMISISDNTATDHLIDLVGRDRVEEALVILGHGNPAATIPMLTTREMFVIKTDPDLLARYEAADEAGRRALLAGEVADAPLPDVTDFPTSPTSVTSVEWFASPADVCRALVTLDDLAAEPGLEPIREILSVNPGVDVGGDYEQILFKGGSEPGVLFGAWLARRPDGSRVVATGGVADTTEEVDPQALQLVALGLSLR